jgi:hypothetical protein
MFKEISEEGWIEQFRPIQNHIDTNASFGGAMFETYGDELEFVRAQDENRIWTYGDGDDGGTFIWSGYHIVNRIGYFITEVPFENDDEIQIPIEVLSELYVCDNCGAEWEDAAADLMWETLQQIGKCAGCATMEEIKEYR